MNPLLIKIAIPTLSNGLKCLQLMKICRSNYQSTYNLKNLYPRSSLKLLTPSEEQINSKDDAFSGYIPIDKIKITSSKPSSPGGQHAHTSNTKVELRFHLETAYWIPEAIRKRLLEKKKNQLTKEGELIIRSDKTRSHQMNVADVLQRLRTVIYTSYKPIPEPNPEWEVTMRKRKEKANEERLKMKRHRSLIKQYRREFE